MPSSPSARSVKISDDERTGWSSDRPRRDAGPPRPTDISTRNRVLRPSDRLRYSPGSLLMVTSASKSQRDAFIARTVEDRGAILSLDKVRGLLAGKVPDEQIEEQAAKLLDAAVAKRLDNGDSVVLGLDTIDAEEREPFLRAAHGKRRPRHLILLEAPRDDVPEELRPQLNELRRQLDDGELGDEGIQTALRIGGAGIGDVKRVVFRPPPAED